MIIRNKGSINDNETETKHIYEYMIENYFNCTDEWIIRMMITVNIQSR
jgi:hypothetical protein